MLTETFDCLSIRMVSLNAEDTPANQVNAGSDHVYGSFTDPEFVRQLARNCDLLTVDIEHVDTDVLEDLSYEIETRPDWTLSFRHPERCLAPLADFRRH